MIRHATRFDIAAMTAIYNEAILEGGLTGDTAPVTLEGRHAWFFEHRDRYAIFVFEIGGAVAGYVSVSPYRGGREAFSGTCEIAYYVACDHRGRGVGKQLVSHAIDYAGRSRFAVAVAILLGSNDRSIHLLERCSFSECGRVRNAACIDGNPVDHLYMSRSLTPDRAA